MAGGRNYYIKGGSNKVSGITDEVRDLVRNQKTHLNMDEWTRQPGIGDPVVFDMQDQRDFDDDQMPDMIYFPHKGEDFHKKSKEYQPAKVLLVKQIKTLRGQPYWHKETLERMGLGEFSNPNR